MVHLDGIGAAGPDGREHFDPAAAFEAMDNADPEEMDQILAHVRQEQAGVTDAIETVVETYLAKRADKAEDFLAAYRRLGAAPFKEALYGREVRAA